MKPSQNSYNLDVEDKDQIPNKDIISEVDFV